MIRPILPKLFMTSAKKINIQKAEINRNINVLEAGIPKDILEHIEASKGAINNYIKDIGYKVTIYKTSGMKEPTVAIRDPKNIRTTFAPILKNDNEHYIRSIYRSVDQAIKNLNLQDPY